MRSNLRECEQFSQLKCFTKDLNNPTVEKKTDNSVDKEIYQKNCKQIWLLIHKSLLWPNGAAL